MSDIKENQFEPVFQELMQIIHDQRELINEMAGYLERLNFGGGGGGSAVLINRTFDTNGTYNASDYGADGFRSVTVDVPQTGGDTIPIYRTGTVYKRFQTVIDPDTEVTYIVTPADGTDTYTSETIEHDVASGDLRLLGGDSRIVVFDHIPSQSELNALPENVVVVEYDPDDAPYAGIVLNENNNNG